MAISLIALCAANAIAQQSVEVRVGEQRAKYTAYESAAAVCEAEPQWLAEELHGVNVMLEWFLAQGSTWKESQLPMLEQAAKALPKMVAAQDLALRALPSCSFAKTSRFPEILTVGVPLVDAAKKEVTRLPELAQFVKHRVALEKWEKQRDARREENRARCAGKQGEEVVFFAAADEFGTRTWEFCDGGVVVAPLTASQWHVRTVDDAGRDAKRDIVRIQRAKLFPSNEVMVPPPVDQK